MKQTLKDIWLEFSNPIPIMCDNSSIINISNNHFIHSRTKHIAIKYHFLKEKVVEKEVIVEYVCTGEQVVDVFTKSLPKDSFEYLRQKWVLLHPPLSLKHFYVVCGSGNEHIVLHFLSLKLMLGLRGRS